MPCIWKPRGEDSSPSSVASMAEELSVSPLIVEILWNRGLTSVDEMDKFLSPLLRHMVNPAEIPGLTEAAEALAHGIGEGRTLAVWGDYDVDGITATCVVKQFLSMRGIEIMHYLPNRMEEGYGMNIPGVERLADDGATMLLTVDCGISDMEPVARARELDMIVVVSDHHMPGDELPDAHAVCNPRLQEGGPCADLAGVGVAFMLMIALNKLLPGDPVDVRPLLDLVALGTIADVVKLTGQNRILVKNGLLLIKEAKRPGMAALKVVSDYERQEELGAGQIGFNLAPRINAAGRMGDPSKALDLLLSDDFDEAMPIAEELNAINMERRRQEQEISEEAFAQAESMKHMAGLVLHADHWHPGIIGIVASRVVEKYYRPTLILCTPESGEGMLKGSGRSISEFDLFESLNAISPILNGYGGHKQAAGMSILSENLDALREQFNAHVIQELGPEPLTPTLKLDHELGFENINNTLLNELELLQPFGMGNPEPVFASKVVTVAEHRTFGREREHVKVVLKDERGAQLPGKAWRMAASLTRAVQGRTMRFAFTPKIDRFRGIPKIDLRIRDWNF